MPERDHRLLIEYIHDALMKIADYVGVLSFEEFVRDGMRVDAVVRNLEIIGEAAGGMPEQVRNRYGSIEWRKLRALRNILTHQYFGVDQEVL